MTTPDGLTAESEALLLELGKGQFQAVKDEYRATLAAIEAAAVARHVRELRERVDRLPSASRLAVAMCETGHPLSPLTGDAIPCGWHLLRADALRAALATPATEEALR